MSHSKLALSVCKDAVFTFGSLSPRFIFHSYVYVYVVIVAVSVYM